MSSDREEESYCRLCAEPTPEGQLIAHDADEAVCVDVVGKCAEINIDMSPSNQLPKTICYSCFDMLRKTFIFLYSARSAQTKLYTIFVKRLNLPAVCELKSLPALSAAVDVKPVKTIDELKVENDVKLEVNIDTAHSVDAATLLNIKKEPDTEGYGGSSAAENYDDRGSDSDLPLKTTAKRSLKKNKRKKKIKKKAKMKVVQDVKEEMEIADEDLDLMPNPDAEAIPIDVSLYNVSWADYEWRCAKCEALCKDLNSLRVHSLELHACCCVFKCYQCGKAMTNYKTFVKHARIHTKALRYSCEYCNKQFTTSQYARKHARAAHDATRRCQNCGASFESRDQLQDHILKYAKGFRKRTATKKEKIEENLKCDFCNKEFKSRSNLQAHKQVHSERSRNFSCHVCGKMFFTRGTLGTHMATHEEVKPFKCDYCPMAFRARGNLLSHISLHSGVKPFVCESCGKSFRVKRHLKSHMIVHTDLMPFSCEYCAKPFRFKTRLNLHLRQHTGQKPYTCMQCQRDFTNGSNYKKHMKRRHNIDTSKKKIVPLHRDLLPFPMPQVLQKFENVVTSEPIPLPEGLHKFENIDEQVQ